MEKIVRQTTVYHFIIMFLCVVSMLKSPSISGSPCCQCSGGTSNDGPIFQANKFDYFFNKKIP